VGCPARLDGGAVRRCHICERRCTDEDEPYNVAMRNGLYVDACWSCWMRWPDEHKRFPPVGFGRCIERHEAKPVHALEETA